MSEESDEQKLANTPIVVLEGGEQVFRCPTQKCRDKKPKRGYFRRPAKNVFNRGKFISENKDMLIFCPNCLTPIPDLQVSV